MPTDDRDVSDQPTIRIGVSACLLGHEVRYDGGHKLDRYVVQTLGRYFEYVPICPEVGIGMGVPRPPIRVVRGHDGLRVRGVRDPSLDPTEALRAYIDEVADQVDGVAGYILKRGSPSCGMERVGVYDEADELDGTASGLYAAAMMARFPLMPVEEEGRLGDVSLRENFIGRVFVYDRWRRLVAGGLTAGSLADFHSRHELLVMAHDQVAYWRLGRLIADADARPIEELAVLYGHDLMRALACRATRRDHTNVLLRLMGDLDRNIDADDRAELLSIFDEYRRGLVPIVVPITLLKHHLRRHPHLSVEIFYGYRF